MERNKSDNSELEVFEGLPPQPVSAEAVKSLGESDAVTGTLPLESRFNDIITEFLLYKNEKIFALAFDPSTETWYLLEGREYTEETVHGVEETLMDRLHDWREEHVLPYLVENDLIPNFEF